MKHSFVTLALALALGLAPFASAASEAATLPLTIHVPVTLKNIDHEFDLFTVDCQIQWTAPFQSNQFANGITTYQKLVNRGFSGTVDVYWTDPTAVSLTKQAVCGITFHSSTDSTKNYNPDATFANPSAAALPLPGAPRMTHFVVPIN